MGMLWHASAIAVCRDLSVIFFQNNRIEHEQIGHAQIYNNNTLVDADHIRRHAHAAVLVRGQRVQ